MNEVFLYSIPEVSEADFSRLLELVSSQRRAKILRLKKRDKQLQSLFAKLVLRAVLCNRMKLKNSELNFFEDENGKPFLKNIDNCYFSISHTDSVVAVALSDCEIGVDVEIVRNFDEKICRRFFSKSEQEYVFNAESGVNERFFEVWTKKESFAKYTGAGLSKTLDLAWDEQLFKTLRVENCVLTVCCKGDASVVPSYDTEKIVNDFIM